MVSTDNSKLKAVELLACVQNYDWGIKGDESLVAQCYSKNSQQDISAEKPYAEVRRIAARQP